MNSNQNFARRFLKFLNYSDFRSFYHDSDFHPIIKDYCPENYVSPYSEQPISQIKMKPATYVIWDHMCRRAWWRQIAATTTTSFRFPKHYWKLEDYHAGFSYLLPYLARRSLNSNNLLKPIPTNWKMTAFASIDLNNRQQYFVDGHP